MNSQSSFQGKSSEAIQLISTETRRLQLPLILFRKNERSTTSVAREMLYLPIYDVDCYLTGRYVDL